MTDHAESESATPQSVKEYRYDTGDVFQGMGGDYWTVTARLWNFDAKETERHGHYGETYEVTMDHDRREYELTSLDPRQLGGETQRLSEHDLAGHFVESTAAEAREHYRGERPDEELLTDGAGEISQRWKCEECSGDLELTEHVANDAHATESFECVDCGATGNVQFFEGPDSPRIYGSVIHK